MVDTEISKRQTGSEKKIQNPVIKKAKRSHHELVSVANTSIWGESLKSLSKSERNAKISEALVPMKGHLMALALKHDTSRVIQACIKNGTANQIDEILEELRDGILNLSKSSYGFHVVVKLINYGSSKVRAEIFSAIKDDAKALALHKDGCKVLDYFWREAANEKMKRVLLRPFYGKEFMIFEYKDEEGKEDLTIHQLLEKHPEKKSNVLNNLSIFLGKISEKGLLGMAVVHRLLKEYSLIASYDQFKKLFEDLADSSLLLMQTSDGVSSLLSMLKYGGNKDRKTIIKAFKDHVLEMLTDSSDSYLAVCCALSVVDDTVLLNKVICSEIKKDIGKIISNQHGRKAILQVLFPFCTSYLSAKEIESFRPVSDGEMLFSKKDDSLRRSEILSSLFGPLLTYVQENMASLLTSKNSADVVYEIVKVAYEQDDGSRSTLVSILLDTLSNNSTLIGDSVAHQVLKKLVKFESLQDQEHQLLIPGLSRHLEPLLESTLTTRGTWVLAALLESGNASVHSALCPKIQQLLSSSFSDTSKDSAGLKLLREICSS